MLGRLFGGSASAAGASFPRDSIVDEEYTRALLYPEHASAQSTRFYTLPTSGGRIGDFDDWRGLDLDASKDLRIIVAQDALGDSEEPCALFDTHPSRQGESPLDSPLGILQAPMHRRGGSTVSTTKAPMSPQLAKSYQRHSPALSGQSFSMHNRSSTFSLPVDEPFSRPTRMLDSREETKTILNCAFGSSAGASTGTKMHILSVEPDSREVNITPSSPGAVGSMSPGYFRKREPITRAHTSTFTGTRSLAHERGSSIIGKKPSDAVLITKLFTANLPEFSDSNPANPPDSPTDPTDPHRAPAAKGRKPRAKKTPMFAIILIIQLPPVVAMFSRPPSQGGVNTPPIGASIRSLQNSIPVLPMSLPFPSVSAVVDRGDARVNALVEHWDIIDRVLAHLERVSTPKLVDHLQRVDNTVASLVNKPSKPKEKTMQRTNQISIYLSQGVLGNDPQVKEEAGRAIHRIQRAFKIPRVSTGQARWGLWNDELIRLTRVYGNREQESFILNLLTSFLGMYTDDWMDVVASSGRKGMRRKAVTDRIDKRTVIVCNDRSVARRLVFLLSSFLAGDDSSESDRGSRKGRGSCVSLRNANLHSPSRGLSRNIRSTRSPDGNHFDGLDHATEGLRIHGVSQRKASDVYSIRSVPIPVNDPSARKSSIVAASNMTPHPTTPIAQFASGSGPDAAYFPDDSSASASLNKIWKSANQDGGSSATSTKWGSLLSGFWGKESNGPVSDTTAPSSGSSLRIKRNAPAKGALQHLSEYNGPELASSDQSVPTVQIPIPKSTPVKLQVNADAGVIDVDICLPGFLSSSGDSAFASSIGHKVRHASSVASLDSLSSAIPHVPSSHRCQSRVAGFLPKFHPDYCLQAIRAAKADMPALKEVIRRAMKSEPPRNELATDAWQVTSETLVANVQTATVKRLVMRERVYPGLDDGTENIDSRSITSPTQRRSSTTSTEQRIEEDDFSYDRVTNLEPLLGEAFEKILSRNSNPISRSVSPAATGHSRANSSTFPNRGRVMRQMPRDDSFDSSSPSGMVSKHPVWRALGEVVRRAKLDVAEEKSRPRNGVEETSLKIGQLEENALTEGVRKALRGLDSNAVW